MPQIAKNIYEFFHNPENIETIDENKNESPKSKKWIKVL